jgi:hypothetical protein
MITRFQQDVSNQKFIHPKSSFYIQIHNERLYMYSAFALPVNETNYPLHSPQKSQHAMSKQRHTIYINSWRLSDTNMTGQFTCCIYKADRNIEKSTSTEVGYFFLRVCKYYVPYCAYFTFINLLLLLLLLLLLVDYYYYYYYYALIYYSKFKMSLCYVLILTTN